jgi:hypothetical protein
MFFGEEKEKSICEQNAKNRTYEKMNTVAVLCRPVYRLLLIVAHRVGRSPARDFGDVVRRSLHFVFSFPQILFLLSRIWIYRKMRDQVGA